MPNVKRKRLLFVDDEARVHEYTRRIGRGHIHEHAYNPEEARQIIRERVSAIGRSIERKTRERDRESNPWKRAVLTRQITFLTRLKSKPLDLVVLDVNMPKGQPTGMELLRELKSNFPEISVLMHSDDIANLEIAAEQGAKVQRKKYLTDEAELKAAIIKELGLDRNRLSLKQLESAARNCPERESMVGLTFSSEAVFFAAAGFVQANNLPKTLRDREKTERAKTRLFALVLGGFLSPNTFKALLRVKHPLDYSKFSYSFDSSGRLIARKRTTSSQA